MQPMKGTAILLLSALLGSAVASAQSRLPAATPDSVGMSTARLAMLDAGIQAEIEQGRGGGGGGG
ncbi:MAG: hypothetical protein ACO280_12640, partial [Pseudohongiellaceae bacterium]